MIGSEPTVAVSACGSPNRRFVLPVVLVLLCLGYFWLATRNNDFHFQQHPDETGKIEQVIEDFRNFNHPLLMVNAAELVARGSAAFLPKRFQSKHWLAKRFTPQDIARLGRALSAVYIALGIFCAALSLSISGRPWAALAAATFLTLDQTLVWAGHFFKEDACLIFGIGLYLLAASLVLARPTRGRFLFLGVAAAVLLSAKWAGGLVLLGHWIGWAAFRDSRHLFRGFGWVLATFLSVFALVNHQLWSGLFAAAQSFQGEIDRLSAGRDETSWVLSYRFWYLDLMTYEPGVLILIAAVPGLIFAFRGHGGPAARGTVFAWLGYTFFLGFAPIPSQRYFVPAAFGVLFFAGLAVGIAIEWAKREAPPRRRNGALAVIISFALIASGWLIRNTRIQQHEFAQPGLPAAWEWIRENLGDKPVVFAQLGRLCLPGQTRVADPEAVPLPGRTQPIDDDAVTYDSLKAAGVTHLIFRRVDREITLRGHGADPSFFEALDTRGLRIHEVPPGGVHIIQPGIEIFEIR